MSNPLRRLAALVAAVLLAAAVAQQLRQRKGERTWHGHLGPVPYDLRPPSLQRIRERWWNPDDPRVLTPHALGVGWSVNLGRLARMLGLA